MVYFTSHAVKRAAQRNLSPEDIHYVLQHGSKIHNAGACFCYLGEKDIVPGDRKQDSIARLEGTTLVLDPEQESIVTLYRNRQKGMKAIRKKSSYTIFAG
mgnify:CR=1 FL=1